MMTIWRGLPVVAAFSWMAIRESGASAQAPPPPPQQPQQQQQGAPARPRSQKDGKNRMQTQAEIASALAQIDDELLATAQERDLTQQAYRVTTDMEFDGIAIRLPRQVVRTADRRGIPMLVMIGQDDKRPSAVPLSRNGIVVATHLGTGKTWTAEAFPTPEQKRTFKPDLTGKSVDARNKVMRDPPPPSGVVSARMMSALVRDLSIAEGIPWTNGDYAVRIVSFDWISNVAPLTLRGGAEIGQLPAIPAVAPGRPGEFPNFVDIPATAPLTTRDVMLVVPNPKVKAGGPAKVQGLLRLSSNEVRAGSGGQMLATVTLLLARRNILTPLQAEVLVPAQQSPGGDWTGQFTIDAARLRALPPAQYLVYAIVGHRISRAVALEVEN